MLVIAFMTAAIVATPIPSAPIALAEEECPAAAMTYTIVLPDEPTWSVQKIPYHHIAEGLHDRDFQLV